jgi:hypothetical protein
VRSAEAASFNCFNACAARLATRVVLPRITLRPVLLVPGHSPQRLGALREHQAEFGQRPADAVDERGAPVLEAFAQAVHGELALLRLS